MVESNLEANCCRLCYSNNKEYMSVFETTASGLNIGETIEKYLKNDAIQEDLMPEIVCVDCWRKTEAFHWFHESVITSQKSYFAAIVKSPITLKSADNEIVFEGVFVSSEQHIALPIEGTSVIDEDDNQNKTDQVSTKKPLQCQNRTEQQISSGNAISTKLYQQSKNVEIPDYIDMTCDLCPTLFKSFQEARVHYVQKHTIPNGYIKCCGIKLMFVVHIKEHIAWHSNPNIFRCNSCAISFKSKLLLNKHKMMHENRFSCKICDKNFASKQALTDHLMIHEDEPQYKCDLCDKKFSKQVSWSTHLRRIHNASTAKKFHELLEIPDYFDMSCDHCPTVFEKFKHAQTHYLEKHKMRKGYIKCCDMKFRQICQIKDHISLHSDPHIFRCEICEISFKSKSLMQQHNIRHGNGFVCEICDKEYKSNQSLKHHRETHEVNEAKYKCDICAKSFHVEYLLRRHIKRTHKKEKTEICEFCAKPFKTLTQLKAHLKIHSKESSKPREKFQCGVCGSWIVGKPSLKLHMLCHTNPVKCHVCNVMLANQRSLKSHKQAFHDNRDAKHKCPLCGKAFRLLSDMKDHVNVHTNEKKHKCSYCDKAFIWRTEMYKHQKKVHVDQWLVDKAKKLASKIPTKNRKLDSH